MSPRAIILDMDGVVVDSEHQWMLTEGRFMRRLVGRWGKKDHYRVVGMGMTDIYRLLKREYDLKTTKKEFLKYADKLAEEIYSKRVSLTPGLRRFLAAARRQRLPLALASCSPRSWVDMVLKRFRLRPAFAAVVTADDVRRTKPAPDIYLLAAHRLKMKSYDCLAIEDSAIGIQAAKAAGMVCLGLRTRFNKEQDLSQADREARGFPELIKGFLDSSRRPS